MSLQGTSREDLVFFKINRSYAVQEGIREGNIKYPVK
jgi:hypothetical protein